MSYFSLSKHFSFEVKWVGCHVFREDFENVSHSNPYYSLLVVSQGPVFLQVNTQKLVLKTGEVLLLNPWTNHSGWREMLEGTDLAWMQFFVNPSLQIVNENEASKLVLSYLHNEKSDLRTYSDDHGFMLLPDRMALKRAHHILSMYEQMVYILENPKGYYRMNLNIILSQMLLSVAEELLVTMNIEQSLSPSVQTYRRLTNFLEESYTLDISRQQIEEKMGLSYTQLCKIFKQHSGLTIFTYLQQLRIQLSKHLLESSYQPIQQISTQVGFNDHYYFTRCFTKHEGVNPSQYRALRRQNM